MPFALPFGLPSLSTPGAQGAGVGPKQTVAPGTGSAASAAPAPSQVAHQDAKVGKQEARVGKQEIDVSVTYLPGLGGGVLILGLIGLAVFLIWWLL